LNINHLETIQILVFTIGVIVFLCIILSYFTMYVDYVKFNTNLNIYSKKSNNLIYIQSIPIILSIFPLLLLLLECEKEQLILLIYHLYPNICSSIMDLVLKNRKVTANFISFISVLYIFSISYTQVSCIICLFSFQFWSFYLVTNFSHLSIK